MGQDCEAIVFTAPNAVEIRRLDLPEMGPDEILVKTLYSMVSSGTELRVLAGTAESKGRFPVIPGYSVVAEVIEVGAEVKGYRVGDLVSGRNPDKGPATITAKWGGQCSHHIYATSGYGCPILLPRGANPMDCVVAEIAAISWRGVHSADAREGETAVVIGQGLIGASAGAWLAGMGLRVIAVDTASSRLDRANRWGVSATVNAADGNTRERIGALCSESPDIVVEASASDAGLRLAYSLIREEKSHIGKRSRWPRLVLQATYAEPITTHPADFFRGEGVLILTPGDRRPEDRLHTVEALRTGRLKAADFVDRVAPFRDAPGIYAQLRDDKDAIFSAVFDWSSSSARK